MSRAVADPPGPTHVDPILWFSRLVRADADRDYPVALLMQQQLAAQGWEVRRIPARKSGRPSRRKEAAR
jgi:hypothetical protein